MQTNLVQWAIDSEYGKEADEILRRCVHCGFCLATCPTYQVTGDERDSPRGRIYLIKQLLEGEDVGEATQSHLDKCLTCHNCETTCPSGVKYGNLVDIGRQILSEKVERSFTDNLKRESLRKLVNSSAFGTAMKIGRAVRPFLIENLKNKITEYRDPGVLPTNLERHEKQVIMLAGCVQPDMLPSIDAATIRVLDKLGIGTQYVQESGCCGAVNFHLDHQEESRDQMRANIDAWLPLIESGQASAIVMNASGCGAMVREYAYHLRNDANYADKAQRIVDSVLDISELIEPHTKELSSYIQKLPNKPAFHPPCTLQHWQGLRALTERVLGELGFDLQGFDETHLCCGSAGAYSMLQPEISKQLRKRKLDNIKAVHPDVIISANVGCISHLQGDCKTPVRHWIEVVDEAIQY